MNRCYAFSRRRFIRCPPRHLAIEDLLTQLLRRYTITMHQIIRCWRTPHQSLTVSIFETVGWTAAPPLVHLVLKIKSWRIPVLIQTKRRIDRRCPNSECWIIRCYYLLQFFSFQSLDASTKWTVSSSDSANFNFAFCVVYQVHQRLLLGYRRFIRRCLFFFFPFSFLTLENRLSSKFGMWYFCILGT
jgi:hypothetical protein